MKISSRVGATPRLDTARPAATVEASGKTFSLKPKAGLASAGRAEVKVAPAEPPVASALRSVAADFKSGKIQTKEEAVQKMVSTMLRDQYGSKVTGDKGFQKMERSISGLISEDPNLSKRIEHLLGRLG